MIIAMNGTLKIEGDRSDVLSECTGVLHAIYEILVQKEGEDAAKEQFAEMGRLAIMTEEELDKELKSKLQDLLDNLN